MISPDLILPQRLAELASGRRGDRPFLVEVDGETMSYRSTHRHVLAWAAHFEALGVEAGSHVATMLPTGLGSVLCWLGLAWLRAVEVPINTQYQGTMLSYVVSNSGARVIVSTPEFIERLRPALADAPNVKTIVVIGDADQVDMPATITIEGPPDVSSASLNAVARAPQRAGPSWRDTSTMLYTSGTTGPSKGVMLPWAQMHATATCSWPIGDLSEDDAFYNPFAMFHITGKSCVYLMALVGGRVVLRPGFKTDRFWNEIEHYGCTTTVLMGVMANFLYRQPGPDTLDTPLRNVLMAPLIPELDDFKRRFGVRICTVFNMTEVASPIASDGWAVTNPDSCGRPRAGYQCRLVDSDDEEVPAGAVGELVVRPDEPWTIFSGYWGMPSKTLESWRNLWFHTGDAFRRDVEGEYYFVDRFKDSIRRRGENISSLEIEREVVQYPDVLEAAAVGIPSEWGEEDIKIVVVAKPGAVIIAGDLADFLVQRLPKFMVPRFIEVVDGLPKTPTEKVKKADLRQVGINRATWDRLEGAQ